MHRAPVAAAAHLLLPPVLLFSLAALAGCSGGEAKVEMVNQPPGAPTVSIGPVSPRTGDALVAVLDAAADDADGDAVTYTYAWKQDGLPRADLTTDTVPASETTKGELWEVTVTPNDGEDDGEAGTASTTILNTAPEVTVAFAPEAPATDDELVAVASATDADGDAVTFTYAWTRDAAPEADVTDRIPADRTEHGDLWAVTVTPSDNEEAGTPVTAEVEIANSAPVMLAVAIVPDAPYVTDDLVAVVEAADADGDALSFTYTWYVDGTEVQSGASYTLAGGGFAKHQRISVEVVPNDGFIDGAAFVSADAVAINSLPTATGASIDPGTGYEASTLTCVPAGFADADGDAEGWTYSWSVNGTDVATTSTLDGSSFNKGDTVACTATPWDGEESGSAVTSAAITISNTAPVLASVDLSTYAPTENDTISVTLGMASDDDGDAVSYGYDWYVNGSVVSTGSTLDAGSFDKGDSIYVVVTPWDGTAYGMPVTSSVATGVNTAPVVVSATIVPENPYVTEALVAVVEASDDDEDTLAYTYTWYVDGTAVQSGASDTLAAGSFAKHARITVEVVPNDGEVDGAAFTSTDAVAMNSVPSATGASIDPGTAYESSTLTCVPAGFADADDDAEGWTYSWSVNGTAVATTATLGGSAFDKGDTVACTATPWDGEESGAAVTAAAVTIGNSVPVLASVALSTYAPTENDTISVTLGTASDADGDTVSFAYDWYVNGAVVSTSSTLLPNRFAKGDSIYLVVTPWDGTAYGAPVASAVATGTNTPPTVTRVTLSPTDVYTDDTLTAAVTATDLDGDTLSYTYDWYVDGVPRGSVASATLSGERYFERDQEVYVVVTPNDGEDEGTAGTSSTVTVLNSPPTAPVVEITPSDAEEGDDLTCTVTTAATDADGDAITYTFAWDVDGAEYTGAADAATSSVVDGADVGGGETWTCEAVASDGADTAASGTSLTVTSPCSDGSVTLTASGIAFVTVCAQTFDMGCTSGSAPCESDETLHEVTLSDDYYVSQTEITQGEFRGLLGYNPSSFSTCGDDCPVENLTWHEAAAYANALSSAQGVDACYTCTGSGASVSCTATGSPYSCEGYRLLTEAEWEAAARCGTDYMYAGSNTLADVAWYTSNSGGTTHTVGTKTANACGLFDMSGNVWEWTGDWYGAYGGTTTDPTGASSGTSRVIRGSSWLHYDTRGSRVAYRGGNLPAGRGSSLGLRLARTAP